jgi:hypothetical protein
LNAILLLVREVTRHAWLFVYDFDLLVEHLASETVDRNVYPVMLFPFHDKVVLICAASLMPRSKKPRVITAHV